MCGSYTIVPGENFYKRFGTENRLARLRSSYNIKPGFFMPVVTTNESKRRVSLMKWGLIPSWAKEPAIGYKMINARSETINEKVSYRIPFKKQRCLVPASGFYEWKKTGKEKIPYYLKLKSENLFSFAGLFDVWKDEEGKEIFSYTIITTEPNPLVAPIHNRMPAILEEKNEEKWLEESAATNKLLDFLKPFPENEMEAYPVSRAVNYAENNSEDLIKPERDNSQPKLF
ncbi:MAG: YoaM [Candidatus Gottesmanbacteria bacterium GW2011_GWA2_43_14]|uniref:Abasic site processing protein n=1 Tax=Candidatus Gottesmanbacteria bacterium GW2011_GWA2_43_14 TaxID=1618443 RepID=A0A0G1DFF1_9BACT|nr:MAG: YoaM [Candidatus Gottesmanbacteria bacterium GW2011_GWA2_43_14]